jgi:DNA-binding transcriptional MocR family regulator
MLDQGWLIAPGALFMPLPQPSTALRVNFAAGQDPRFWRALRQAVEDRKPT